MLNHFVGSIEPAWLPNGREFARNPRKEGNRHFINAGVLLPDGVEETLVRRSLVPSGERLESFTAARAVPHAQPLY